MTRRRTTMVLMLVMSISAQARAQELEVATDLLEPSAEELEISDFELEELQRLLEDPIDVNAAMTTDLLRIPYLDAPAAERIVAYRRRHGALRTWSAVRAALGPDAHVLDRLRPFLVIRPVPAGWERQARERRAARGSMYVATQFYWRRDTDVPQSRGVPMLRQTDRRAVTRVSIMSPRGLEGRLTLARGGNFVAPEVGGAEMRLFEDRLSVVGGAYGVRFGSGLLFSGGGMRDTWRFASGSSAIRSARITPRSSASTDDHLTGTALRFSPSREVRVGVLYGKMADDRERLVSVLAERSDAAGSFGIMLVRARLEPQITARSELHMLRRFSKDVWRAASLSIERSVGAHRIGAEAAIADPGVAAVVVALSTRLASSSNVTVLLRSVSSRFSMRHGSPSAVDAADGTGETGVLVAAGARRGSWRFRFVADAAARPWASSSSAWPAEGWSARGELTREFGSASLSARVTHALATADAEPMLLRTHGISVPRRTRRTGVRLQADVPVGRSLEARFRWEISRARDPGGRTSYGGMLYHQVRWRPTPWLVLEARDVSFVVQATEARLYMHETDVLYQSVLSTLSGDGVRRYLRARLDVGTHVTLEGKVGLLEQVKPGSGDASPPQLQRRTDARIQIRLKR